MGEDEGEMAAPTWGYRVDVGVMGELGETEESEEEVSEME